MINNYYLLPEFTPARLQDLVLWFEPGSFRGNTWYNLALNYSDRNRGTAHGDVGLSSWHPLFPPTPTFYGDDEYVKVPNDDSLDVTDKLTLEVWVNLQEQNSGGLILKQIAGKTSQYALYINRDNLTFNFYTYPSGSINNLISTISLTKGKFYHIVAILGENGKKLYINSELDNSNGLAGTQRRPFPFGIGGDPSNAPNRELNGSIPLVRIYKAVLTPTEIMHNYTHHPLYFLQKGINPYEFIKRKKFYFL